MAHRKKNSFPKANKGKGRKWKKGQSSNSNPVEKRFRQAAKNRFFHTIEGPSNLTVEALSQHNEAEEEKPEVVEMDVQTTSAKTFNTWATNWTDCTNATFSRVHRYWRSNSATHKEILAVLAAITEVIKQQGGNENETEYFAALMTALETTEPEESLAAITYLLSLVIKRVPAPVLKSRFSQVSKLFLDILAKHSDGNCTSLLKSLLLCLASVLRVQEVAVWNNSSTQQMYSGLLTFVTHKKPKVRKAAHQAVQIILKGSLFMLEADSPLNHPAASLTAKYCIQQIEQCGGTGEATNTLYSLALLRDVMSSFSKNSIQSCCETVLRVMTISNVMVRACGMQTLHGLFSSKPKSQSLPAELNARIVVALYDYQPSENDSQPVQAWLAVMETAHVTLHRSDARLCTSHLPKLFSTAMTYLLSSRQEVAQAAIKTMKVLLSDCLTPDLERLTSLLSSAPGGTQTPVHKIIKALESGLSYQFHSSWGLVLQLWAAVFQVFGKCCPGLLKKCLLSMADLRETPHFAYRRELDQAIGSAIRYMGPRHVLDAVPLNMSPESDELEFPRSWLIPVLRDNIRETELGFFTSYFLPLAAAFRQKALQCPDGQSVAAKTYDTLQQQIWSLLSGFCQNPTDITQSFKGIAKILGSAITDRPDLRMTVMSSLRALINNSLSIESHRSELSRFSKNFVPILLNLFTADPEKERDPTRLAVLETLKTYLQIVDKQLALSFFDKCVEKMNASDTTPFKRHALIDLNIALLPYIDTDRLKISFDLASANLSSLDRTLQKKSYRIMEEICAGKSEDCQEFARRYLSQIQKMLLSSLSKSSPSSKAPRLRCLIHIFGQLKEKQMDFFMAVVPEVIMCTREIGEKAREAAYNLLITMAETLTRWSSSVSKEETIDSFLKMLLAGLAGSPQMISGTLLALTRVLFQYKQLISSDLLEILVENTCLLLTSKLREVVKSALGFIKVLISAYQDTQLAGQLKRLVTGLVSMKDDTRHHFHIKMKHIFAKLIKKFGYETIRGMTPERLHKVLHNIYKTQQRTKRQKKEELNQEESEEEVEEKPPKMDSIDDLLRDTDSELENDDDTMKKKPVKKRRGRDAWLKEGEEDQIVDFLDPNAAKRVLATKPEQKTDSKHKKDLPFKMAPDGRLIITEDEPQGDRIDSGEEDDLDDLLQALEGGTRNKKSAKKRKLEEDSDDETGPAKYKAGGSGIHRPLTKSKHGKPVQKVQMGQEYRAKKARGDVKKAGKPDPFAYVPLNMQSLNKRKRAKIHGQFGNLVKGAKKGALKGMRNKRNKK
ncbi:RRP12-like protein [Gigantopelta aegis]|uniref:RRP12-like protein n=1 Tax=Gigantopelta aegis TaxID=1735272 RepID=UPI001B8879AA|nr:RRP12-like protein [Gigantopelta aegis]